MDDAPQLPNDLAECQQLLLAAFQESTQREHRVIEAERHAAELSRVLDQTAASYEQLQDTNAQLQESLQATVEEIKRCPLRKSPLSKAVWYARNQWQALRRYTEDGRLSIDNNKSDRSQELAVPGKSAGRAPRGGVIHDSGWRQATPDRALDLLA